MGQGKVIGERRQQIGIAGIERKLLERTDERVQLLKKGRSIRLP